MNDIIFNYDSLLELIYWSYDGCNMSVKIRKFCKDAKMNLDRFKRIVECRKYCFLMDEVYRMKKVLNISDKDLWLFFLNVKEAKHVPNVQFNRKEIVM